MKKFYTQTYLITVLRIIALITFILALIIGVFEIKAFIVMIFPIFLLLLSFLGYINRIIINGNDIVVKVSPVWGKYTRDELKEIIVYGSKFSYGRARVDLYFKKEGTDKKSGVRTDSNPEMLKELFIDFNGIIIIKANRRKVAKERLYALGAIERMFE